MSNQAESDLVMLVKVILSSKNKCVCIVYKSFPYQLLCNFKRMPLEFNCVVCFLLFLSITLNFYFVSFIILGTQNLRPPFLKDVTLER